MRGLDVSRHASPATVSLAVTLLAVTGLLGGSTGPGLADATATQAAQLTGAGWLGADISWPQCPHRHGSHRMRTPATGTRFVVIGVTAGHPHSTNPCLGQQLRWAASHSVPAHAYIVVAWPTASELRRARGGRANRDTLDALRAAGRAQARSALNTLSSHAFRPPMVWLDVETIRSRAWPTGTAARRTANRALLLGVMRGLADAGFAYGLYSYARAWRHITGRWRLPGVPVWATAGRRHRADAVRMCRRPSFSAGPVHLAQWYDDSRDSDITCPPFLLVPAVVPPPSGTG